MIDFEGLKTKINILDLVGGLKKVASTGGGEYAGPCPICRDGEDRFRVQPSQNIWLCRKCTDGAWRDVVDFIAMRDNISLMEAARIVSGGSLPDFSASRETEKPRYYAYNPPDQDWQDRSREAAAICEGNLYSDQGGKALAYLHKRGLTDNTIKHFRLGYSPGAEMMGLFVTHGITIPAEINGVLWYVKIRTNKPKAKYTLVKGSRPAALYNGDDLIGKQAALIVEGEFNAMIAYQETQDINDICGVASMGAAGNRPDLVKWGGYIRGLDLILALYDQDPAGESGALALFETLGDRVKFAALPKGAGDLNDWHITGGNINHWLACELAFHKGRIKGG